MGLSLESCRWGTSSEARVLLVAPEFCLKGLSVPRRTSKAEFVALLNGREKLKDGLDMPALLMERSEAIDDDRAT